MGPSYHSPHSVVKKISNYIFRFEDKIGQGNFSKVYKGYHQLSSKYLYIIIFRWIGSYKNHIAFISKIK